MQPEREPETAAPQASLGDHGADPLLEGLRRRDPEAMNALVREHARRLYRSACGLGVPAADAEDLVQEVFIVCIEGVDRFEGRSQVRTWLWGILRNKAHEYFRDRRHEQPADDATLDRLDARLDASFAARFDSRGRWQHPPVDIERLLRSSEAGAAIHHCLDGLGPQQREVFVLREIEAMKTGDIGALLGLTINHCGVLLHRARMRLQNCLEHAGWGTAQP